MRFPGLVTLRCMRALASATAGRRADTVAEIKALADGDFAALPRDSLYLASLAILAEATVTCRVTDPAGKILAELTPYAARNLIQGVPVGWGAAAWYIARLQWLLGRHAEAARSAATAQRLHRQWGGRAEVPAFFKALGGTLQITEFTRLSFTSNETDVMVVTHWAATALATGKSTAMDIHHWWRFRDGKIYFYRGTEDTARTADLLSTN